MYNAEISGLDVQGCIFVECSSTRNTLCEVKCYEQCHSECRNKDFDLCVVVSHVLLVYVK